MSYIKHPLIKENSIESRIYQEVIAARALEKGNTLVVAPTALGKTVVAMLLAAQVLQKQPDAKVVFLAPTKPLAMQHDRSFRKFLELGEGNGDAYALLTGTIPTKKRTELWESAKVISATPQTIENDIVTGRIRLDNVGLMIFDEAHRAVGDYAYVFIANMYAKQRQKPFILALTASPGSEEEHIDDVCRNLFISNIEVKTPQDADVKPYVNEIDVEWIRLELPQEFIEVKKLLEEFMKEQLEVLKKFGLSNSTDLGNFSKIRLLEMQNSLRRRLASRHETQPSLYIAVSKIAALLKVSHAHILLETQGIQALNDYFNRMNEKSGHAGASKALKGIVQHDSVRKAMALTKELNNKGVLHPKIIKLSQILEEQFKANPESRVIVFNHYRDSVRFVVEFLKKFPEIRASAFVGQATKEGNQGMSQKEQADLLEKFKAGEYNTLVATSVAEEGLDIPAVDLVIFFEAVPSEIRAIQRRGRTGRFSKGKAIILMAKGTRDEGFYWSSVAKERRMHKTLRELKHNADEKLPKHNLGEGPSVHPNKKFGLQSTLVKFVEEAKDKAVIYVDTREQASSVARRLTEMGAIVKVKQLDVGDYVLSDEIAVERKTVDDFLQSMIDGRLFSQMVKLASNYPMPLVIVEGSQDELFTLRNIHRKAIIGALTSIALNYRTPVIFTKDAAETAEYMFVTAKREQLGKDKEIRLRVGRKGLTLKEQQQFVVESLPMVGPAMAKKLLGHFGSVKAIANALSKDLQEVEGLGSKKAQQIKKVFWSRYKKEG